LSLAESGWLAPLVSALLMWSVGIFVLIRAFQNRMRGSLYWGIGLVSYGSSHLMEFAFLSSLIVQDSLSFFIRQTLVAIFLVLFYAGCSLVLAKRMAFKALSALFFFVVQALVLFYLDFVVVNFTLSSTIHIIFFVIPFSVFFAGFFMVDYLSSKRRAALVIAIAWLVYAVIVPIYFLWKDTPLLPIWFILRTVSLVPLFLGFVLLARSTSAKARQATVAQS
jgi:hypothetical protein